MQQKILLNITWSDRCCTLICNILSLFHFIVQGMIGMSWVHFKEIYFTLLYAIQENVFEARNKQWELKCTFSQQKGIF